MLSAVRGKARASHRHGASETLWLLLLTGKKASPAVRSKKLGFRMSRDNVNAVFYEETYHPIKAGSIDGTDFVPSRLSRLSLLLRSSLSFVSLTLSVSKHCRFVPYKNCEILSFADDPLGDPNLFGDSYSLAALFSPPAFLTNPSNTCFTRKVFMAFGWYGSSYEKASPRKNLRLVRHNGFFVLESDGHQKSSWIFGLLGADVA